jgi:hypothetical protein
MDGKQTQLTLVGVTVGTALCWLQWHMRRPTLSGSRKGDRGGGALSRDVMASKPQLALRVRVLVVTWSLAGGLWVGFIACGHASHEA